MSQMTSPAETEQRMVVCIAGMHRSGTSMIARMLNLAGLHLGQEKDLIPAAEDNPEGFWEHVRFQAINEEILAAFGGSWDLPPQLEPGWEQDPRLLFIRTRAIALIDEFSGYPVWGWKDPRSSLTLPFWQSLIPGLKIVICLRNPYDVYRSLARRGYASSAFSYDLWLAYSRQLMAAVENQAAVVTHFDSYFQDTPAELRRLTDSLGLRTSDQAIAEACKSASVKLRHSFSSIADLQGTNAPPELLHIYKEMCRRAGPVFDLVLPPEEPLAIEDAGPGEAATSRDLEGLASALRVELQLKNMEIHNKDEVLRQKDAALRQKDEVIRQKDAALQQQDAALRQKEHELEQHRTEARENLEELANVQSQLQAVLASRGWRLVRYMQRVREFLIPVNSSRERLLRAVYRSLRGLLKGPGRRSGTGAAGDALDAHAATSAGPIVAAYRDLVSSSSSTAGIEYVPLASEEVSSQDAPLKFIAFYLPQYHPIPENDEWWGRGFTEWSNVSKAVPQFVGHYQPRLPGELGFYDLRVPEIQERQIELARKYGIHGFAFHYYWFNGKRLLEKPLDLFLESSEDFPFCICWANENWTRRWDGQESEVLIAQEHSAESDLRFIRDISPILQDERYIRINGRPLLIVYRPNILPDVTETVARWREYCKDHGMPDPYLVAAQTFWFTDPRQVDFDAAVEFPPHNVAVTDIHDRLQISNPGYQGNVIDYREIVEKTAAHPAPGYKQFKTVFPSWDNEARKPGRGYTFAFSTPGRYKDWLLQAGRITLQEPDPEKRLLFINAWNEWGEGAYLEPDRRYGYAYLQATADALRELSWSEARPAASLSTHPPALSRPDIDPRLLDPVIIFQSGKVGSLSVQKSLEEACKALGIPVAVSYGQDIREEEGNAASQVVIYHAHALNLLDEREQFVRQIRENPQDDLELIRKWRALRQDIDDHPDKKWNIINLVRDPVAIKVSALFQVLYQHIPDWEERLKAGRLSMSDLDELFYGKEEFGFTRLDRWHDEQIKAIWGLDVFEVPFAREKGYQIYESGAMRLMVLRLEDLNRIAGRAFEEFLGLKDFKVVSTNVGEEKPYSALYREFKKRPLSAEYVERGYQTRFARHFYTPEEIAGFRDRWLNPERAKEAAE